MSEFQGFPAGMGFTRIPDQLFALLPRIEDMAQLKTLLHFFELIYRKKGYPRFVSRSEMRAHPSLVASLRLTGKPIDEALGEALARSVELGALIGVGVETEGGPDDLYFMNAAAERDIVARIRAGALVVRGVKPARPAEVAGPLPDVFALYEQNIGVLTPIIADELQAAEKVYPADWIRDAIREAVAANKRKWSYIARILETWSTEGKHDGTHRRRPEEADPDYYTKGRYGDRVQR